MQAAGDTDSNRKRGRDVEREGGGSFQRSPVPSQLCCALKSGAWAKRQSKTSRESERASQQPAASSQRPASQPLPLSPPPTETETNSPNPLRSPAQPGTPDQNTSRGPAPDQSPVDASCHSFIHSLFCSACTDIFSIYHSILHCPAQPSPAQSGPAFSTAIVSRYRYRIGSTPSIFRPGPNLWVGTRRALVMPIKYFCNLSSIC